MTDEELAQRLRRPSRITKDLAQLDFDVERVANGPVEPVRLPDGGTLTMIAGDSGGGAFLLAPADGDRLPLVYAGSEGEGGLIAGNLREGLALVVGLSSISDATARPYAPDAGATLRAWLAAADEEIRQDWPDLDAIRARLREALDLPPADGLLEALHEAAADERYRPVSEHGPYESLLG